MSSIKALDNDMVKSKPIVVSVSMSAEDKKAIKLLAIERETNVSALIHEWLHRELDSISE